MLSEIPKLLITKYNPKNKLVAIIDLETMGLDYKKDKIIEIGIIVVSVDKKNEFVGVHAVFSQYNDPMKEIPFCITTLTGIDNKKVEGHRIDWDAVMDLIEPVDYIVCHHASFDRKFLEGQTPTLVSNLFKKKSFGCSKHQINWAAQGYSSTRLIDLNHANGYKYLAHRAINDCWATLTIVKESGSFPELINNIYCDPESKDRFSEREMS